MWGLVQGFLEHCQGHLEAAASSLMGCAPAGPPQKLISQIECKRVPFAWERLILFNEIQCLRFCFKARLVRATWVSCVWPQEQRFHGRKLAMSGCWFHEGRNRRVSRNQWLIWSDHVIDHAPLICVLLGTQTSNSPCAHKRWLSKRALGTRSFFRVLLICGNVWNRDHCLQVLLCSSSLVGAVCTTFS